MSFSAQTKTELCAIPVSRDCCAVAEAYGLLLFAHTFSHTEIAVVTANEALAKRVPPLSKPGMSHRLKRIVAMAKAAVQEEHT